MLRVRCGERRRSGLRIASTAAVVAVLAGTSAAFAVRLAGELVTTTKAYALDRAVVSGKRRDTLRVSLARTDNPAPAQAIQTRQTTGCAEVALLAPNLAVLKTHTLAGAAVTTYRQTGDAATNAFTQELALKSKTLALGKETSG